MATEPKISGSTNKLMMAQRIPRLKYSAALCLRAIEYVGGFAGGWGDPETEFTFGMQAFSKISLNGLSLNYFSGACNIELDMLLLSHSHRSLRTT